MNIDHKLWFAEEINSGRSSSRILADRFNLKPDTLRKFARCVRNDKKLFSFGGRPRIIDAEGFLSVQNKKDSFPLVERKELYSFLVEEHRNTLKRQKPHLEDKELPRKLKKHTKERYVSMFMREDVDETILTQIAVATHHFL